MNVAASGILSRTAELIFLMSKGTTYNTNQLSTDVWWNIWRISNRDKDNMQNGHGASFPVKLVYEALGKFSREHAIIFDPFMGSGTTIIACEQANRTGRGIEIEPRYCDVIIRRWETSGEQQLDASVYSLD